MREYLLLAGLLVSLLHLGSGQGPPPQCKADSSCSNHASCPEDYPVCAQGQCCPKLSDGKPDGASGDGGTKEGTTDGEPGDGETGGTWNTSCPALSSDSVGICIQECNDTCDEAGKVCCRNGCGKVCVPDLTRCASTSAVLNTVMSSTDCIGKFVEVLAAREYKEFCRHFWSGLTCAAKGLTAGTSYDKICLERMGRFISEDTSGIIAAIKSLVPIDTGFAEKAAQCEQNPYGNVAPPTPTGLPDNTCGEISFSTSLISSSSLCIAGYTSTVTASDKTKEEYCSAFTGILICIFGKEVTDKCMESIKNKTTELEPMLAGAGINLNFDPSTCPGGKTDGEPEDGETGDDTCGEITLDSNILSSECAAVHIFTLRTSGKTNVEYCSAFMGLLNCAFGRENLGKCMESMRSTHIPNLISILKEAKIGLNFDPSKCMEGTTDGEPGDGETGGTWNTSCPALSSDSVGICIQECDDACDEAGEVCCRNGCGKVCVPDLTRCASTSAVLNTVMSSADCIGKFAEVLAAREFKEFCRHFWSGLTCAAKGLTAGTSYNKICLERMGRFISEDTSGIIAAIKKLVQIDTGFAERAAQCEENPYGNVAPPPPTGVPATDDVKMCTNITTILNKFGNCGTTLGGFTTPSYTAEYCRSIKEMVYCVAGNFFPSDSHRSTQCASIIVRMVETQSHMFSRKVPSLATYDHKRCVVKATACGMDVEPLEGVTCPRTKCPAKYECKAGHCCPTEKKGVCPARQGNPICGPKCKKDGDCEDDQKCCNQGCGGKTCTKTESRQKTECETAFQKAKWQLQKQGICGDGRSETVIPRCDQKGKYLPTQGTVGGMKQCVYENGTAIPGSEHSGNVDCTKVRPGVCPTPPSTCDGGPEAHLCVEDMGCNEMEKCCVTVEQGTCLKKCVRAEIAPTEATVDDCPNRQCCPVTLCQGKICAAHPAAVCRINSCGGCTVDFYDADGQVVDCMEGLTACERQRSMGSKLNSDRMKTDDEKISEYINENAPYTEGDLEDDDEDDEDSEENEDSESEDEDLRFELFEDDSMEREERPEDEFEEDSVESDNMGSMEDDDDDSADEMEKKMSLQSKVCGYLNNQNFCLNGARCVAGESMNMFELCECPVGYYGLRCNKTVTTSFNNTECRRMEARVNMLMTALDKCSMLSKVLNFVMTALKPKMFPMPTCTADGKFATIQTGFLLPKTKKNHVNVSYCVDMNTGMRIPNTIIAYNGVPSPLNCNIRTEIDIKELPMKCHRMSPGPCDSAGGATCQYYYNNVNRMCEAGPVGQGFTTLTACYQKCGFAKVCSSADDTSCQTYTPIPCENNPQCNYAQQYCDVTVNQQSNKQSGECKRYQSYCLEPMDYGTGTRKMWRYYFNTTNQKCQKFVYSGAGGNGNRFYSPHQCETECAAQEYKYSGLACPSPRIVAGEMMGYEGLDTCNQDSECKDEQVCCSNLNNRRCVNPILDYCATGERCSFYGTCNTNVCTCPDCDDQPVEKVCGSDGMTYDNMCQLEHKSCRSRKYIGFKSNGECPSGATTDMQMDCPYACPAIYQPLCVYDKRTQGSSFVQTYSNLCLMKNDMKCNGKDLQVLYPGECQNQCNPSCKPYEDCNGTACVCLTDCTDEPFKPVCAHPFDNTVKLRTFSNVCEMRMEACKMGTLYVISKMGPCSKPSEEDLYQCPKTDPDLPNSAEYLCEIQTNSRCDSETQRCCPHGQGSRCVDKKDLVRVEVTKDGVCPAISALTFDMSKCPESRCRSHSDCDGDGMCCDNIVCSHKTCASPIVKSTSGLCGQGMKAIPRSVCNETNACPVGGKYVTVKTNNKTVGICCVNTSNNEALQGEKVCEAMEWMGIKCQNGGRCVGNLRSGQLCQCVRPFYGAVCQKKVPQDTETEPCEDGVYNCLVSPCSVQKCPRYPDATCKDNTCGGCNAIFTYKGQNVTTSCEETKCLKLKSQMEQIMRGMSSLMNMMGDNEGERAKRGVPTLINEETEDSDSDEEKEDEDKMEDEGKFEMYKKFFATLVETGLKFLPLTPDCTEDGHFKKVQCFMDLRRMKKFCACVNKTGEFNEHSPLALNPGDLKCLDTDVLPAYCLERPVVNQNVTCGVSTKKYFFSAQKRDCVAFRYNGCDRRLKNMFADYNTCISTCSSKSFQEEVCKGVRCRAQQMCKVVKGEAKCVDMDDGQSGRVSDVVFEPVCNDAGQFEPKQCIGHVCACVNPDTGEPVKGPAFNAQNINCTDPSATLPAEAKNCPDGTKPSMCREGGDPCKNCERSGREGTTSDKLKEDGVCKACTQCPGGQRKVCHSSCANATCEGYPEAACTINTCTCALEFRSGNKVIKCESTYAECVRQKSKYEGESSSRGANSKSTTQLRCSATGGYYAMCKGNACHCLNASTGEKFSNARTGVSIDTIDCSQAQKKTDAKRSSLLFKVSNESFALLTDEKKIKFNKAIKPAIEKDQSLKLVTLKLKSGSILADCQLEVNHNVLSETKDLPTLTNALSTKIREGSVSFEVDGQTYVASDPVVQEYFTAEDIEEPVEEKEEKNKKTIIIVVVVVVVVLLLAVVIGCCCYQKSKANKKQKDIPFTDIEGKSNPTYMN